MTCGSAFKNKGVQAVLDAVVEYMPSPVDVPPVKGQSERGEPLTRHADDNEPFAALAFKILNDPFVGNLTFFRVYSGTLNSGDQVFVPNKSRNERIGRLLQMHASERSEIKEVRAGDIAAAVGLKDVTTGDTLSDPHKVIILEKMEFPEPVISVAVEPKTKVDQEKMGLALQRLAKEDPSFRVHTDQESGQTIISGMGELHLEIIVDRMKREFKVEANVGKPQVAYRETLRGTVESEGKFVRQSGGRGQYGHVWLKIEPLPQGKGYEFVNAIVGGAVPREFIPAVDKGIQEAVQTGVIAGYPIVDVKVTAFDGSYHDVDSNEMAFKIAGSIGLQGGLPQGEARAARAHHEGRGGDARGLLRRHRRRFESPPRTDHRHGRLALGQGGDRRGAARGDVPVLDRHALHEPGPRELHHGVREVHGSAEQRRRRRHEESVVTNPLYSFLRGTCRVEGEV